MICTAHVSYNAGLKNKSTLITTERAHVEAICKSQKLSFVPRGLPEYKKSNIHGGLGHCGQFQILKDVCKSKLYYQNPCQRFKERNIIRQLY